MCVCILTDLEHKELINFTWFINFKIKQMNFYIKQCPYLFIYIFKLINIHYKTKFINKSLERNPTVFQSLFENHSKMCF